MDWYATYIPNPYAAVNPFRKRKPHLEPLPTFAEVRSLLPQPFWAGHDAAIACYWKVWQIAFRNLCQPMQANGFVSPYIDTAHNGNLFMWDSAFILMFARYGRVAFNFQQTLDNLYSKQHPDGFICREICPSDGSDCFKRFDPCATGPDIMGWSEWAYFQQYGDRQRLADVFPALLAFHQWLRHYRTWQDGTYWATGWACGMDNQPRLSHHDHLTAAAPDGPVEWWDHGHMAWIDACFQGVLAARVLAKMAEELGETAVAAQLTTEANHLSQIIEATMWDDKTGFYVDRRADGSLSPVHSIASFWGLLAGLPDVKRRDRLVAHLRDECSFNRPHRVPTLAASHRDYRPGGQYWRGGVWPPTNYMILRGLTAAGYDDLAYEIGRNHHNAVVAVFEETGTVWENYAPETITQGNQASPEFVGWGGLPPTAVLFEYVFGLRADYPRRTVVWDVRLLEEHGVNQYPFGEGLLDLYCAPRAHCTEKPTLTVTANVPVTLEIRWAGGKEYLEI